MAFMITLLGVVGVALFLRIRMTVTASRADEAYREMRGGVRDARGGELGTYELAYLAGGPLRVVNTGLAALVGQERLRLSRGGTLHRVAGAGRPDDDVERALVDAVERPGGRRGVTEVRREVSRGPEVEALRHRLVGMGLLAGDDGPSEVRGLLRDLLRWSRLTLLAGGVAVLGVVPMAQVSGDAAFVLVGGSVVLAVLGLKGWRLHRRKRAAMENLLTHAGRERLLEARETYAREGVAALALAPVAVFGLQAVGDAQLKAELARTQDGAAACGGGTFGAGDFGTGGDAGSAGGGDGGGGDAGGGAGCGGGCGGCGG